MEQGKPDQERRQYARLSAKVKVTYTIIGKPGEIKVFSRNISAGGLCISAAKKIIENTPLQLEIKIPDLKDPISALAIVVWQKSPIDPDERFETGVKFTGISDFDRFNIKRYVEDSLEA